MYSFLSEGIKDKKKSSPPTSTVCQTFILCYTNYYACLMRIVFCRLIVSMRSDVFHAMLYENDDENDGDIVDLPGVLPEAFANTLNFIYTDAVEHLDLTNVIPTLYCAEKFELPWLAQLCAGFAIERLDADNCLTFLGNVGLVQRYRITLESAHVPFALDKKMLGTTR
ncbi:kelch-like protein 24 [Paramacrobiotus metropolitanus]|uniref:kelch-like protein 24 n=1 Tax=Paramacrobiotus metropolitanus TaxID=2943436 RepID=UPI002445C55D|nr:kelch-like protein 24 [Paramacrobiotus metropolitanus]